MKRHFLIGGLLLAGALNIFAQNIYISTDSTATPELKLGEVVISASKDNSELKKLPTSVSLISSTTIASNEIKSLNDVTSLAANFVMPDYGSKLTSPVYIRGIGSRINSPSVGLYVDGIPYFEKAAFDFDFFDVDRVEILKGPQGTLYGRNSMGGLINVVTKSPMTYQGGFISISAASYGDYKLNASYYQKPGKNLAFSLASSYRHNDGFFTNKYLNKRVDACDSYGIRGRFIYKLSDYLTLENIANFEQSKQGGYPYAIFNDSLNRADDINYNQASTYDRKMFSNGLNLSYSKENWELINTLSYQLLDDDQKIDQDFTVDSLYFIEQTMKQNMFADEFIMRSKNEKRYKWLLGAFGFNQDFDKAVIANIYPSSMWYIKNYWLQVSSVALFHQSTFNITEKLTLTAGVRFDMERSKLHYTYNMERNGTPAASSDTVYPELTDNVILPKVSLNYSLNNVSIYATYTTGYKPGGFNSTFETPDELMFKHENSYNYELGVKSSLYNGAIYGDLSLFLTKLENQQIYRIVPSGRGSYLDNAGLSENKGFEISTTSRPYKGFSASLAYGYTYSQILKYEEDSLVNYNNNLTPYIPRHTLAVQLNQTIDLPKLSYLDKIKLNLTYTQQGELYWDLENNYKEKTYGMLNGKISFVYKDIQLDVWGKNLTNSKYNSFLFEALGNTYVQPGRPMQIGLNLSVKF